jgi:hypothetical protein
MRGAWRAWIALCMCATTQGCRAPSPDWDGIWKLNPTKSTYQGQVFTISVSGDGEFRFGVNSSNTHTLRCDGKDQPGENNRTLVCVTTGATIIDITEKENGTKTKAIHDEISTDRKIFTSTITEFRQSGPAITSHMTFARLSGANDFAGQWRDTTYVQQHADMILKLDNQALHIEYPNPSQNINAPLDGSDADVRGTNIIEGATFAARPTGNREFRIVTKHHGKVFTQGSLKLSNDGRTITESWWNPDRPDAIRVFVYDLAQRNR